MMIVSGDWISHIGVGIQYTPTCWTDRVAAKASAVQHMSRLIIRLNSTHGLGIG